MRTNLEKWNYYMSLINNKEQEFINSNIKDIPTCIYEVYSSGKLRTLNVTGVRYRNELYGGTKPSREDVAKIKAYYENMPELIIEKVSINWECTDQGYKSSSAVRYLEMKEKYFTSKEDADKKAFELTEIKRKEEELLNNGHIKCTYCGKVVPEKETVNYEIIFQNSRPDPFSRTGWKKFVDRKTNKYCSKQCGAYDQMAHEG
jgi:hypothetical protein